MYTVLYMCILCILLYIHTCIHIHVYTCIHVYMHTCIHTCIHVYIQIYRYIYRWKICFISLLQISTVNEYNTHWHCDSHHSDKFRNLQGIARKDKVKEFMSGLKKPQITSSHSMEVSCAHFSCIEDLCNAGSAKDLGQYKENISSLLQQFQWHFQVFYHLLTELKIYFSPFSVTPSDAPNNLQLEIINLQYNANLKEKFCFVIQKNTRIFFLAIPN